MTRPLLTFAILCALCGPLFSADRPNIVLIMADDMGFSDIGCFGSEIKTPALDRMAEEGVVFTQFYNGARCCPTRAALLTGLYAHQAGMGPDWEHHGNRAIRKGDWKLVARGEKSAWELYDMKTDRTEINNLAADKPKLVKELDALWWKWAERCRVLPMNPNHKGEFLKRKQEAQKRKKEREAEAKQREANPGS